VIFKDYFGINNALMLAVDDIFHHIDGTFSSSDDDDDDVQISNFVNSYCFFLYFCCQS